MRYFLTLLLFGSTFSLFAQNQHSNKVDSPVYEAYLALTKSDFSCEKLEDLGGTVRTQIGEVVTFNFPKSNESLLSTIQGIQYWQRAAKVKPLLNRTLGDTKADTVHKGHPALKKKYKGKDVIIGITDWGFDYTHPNFQDSNGRTRILAAWDQYKKSGPHPAGYNYGTEHEGNQELMDAKADTSNVYSYATHGTHVAGIAGGNGAGTQYVGMAPEANFLFVTFLVDEAAFLDGVAWMKEKADWYKKRLVVNMSWGLYNIGSMDGNSLVSKALDAFSEQGVIFVTSGGNNGDVNFHIKKSFDKDTLNTRVEFYPYGAHEKMWGQSITMWGEENQSFSSYFSVYDAQKNLLSTGPVFSTTAANKKQIGYQVVGTDTIFYKVDLEAKHPINNRPFMQMRIKNENASLRIGLHSFAEGGTVHYWNVVELTNDVGNWGLPFSAFLPNWEQGDNEYGIGEPATTKSVITVAAHQAEYRAPNGVLVGGKIAAFSSIGPTLDERKKPDLSAPGVSVVSSVSSYTDRSYTSITSVDDNGKNYHFAAFSGTSMSSPSLAGAVALLLEANPLLTPQEVKELLQKTAREDDKTGIVKDSGSLQWGQGKLDVLPAIISAEAQYENEETIVYPNPVTSKIHISSPNKTAVEVQIYTVIGELVLEGIIDNYSPLDVRNLRNGLYYLVIDSEVFKLAKE